MKNTRIELLKNAEKLNIFGGKRFLGLTPNGKEVWISFTVARKTGQIKINTTHQLDVLLLNNAKLARRRITIKRGNHNNRSTNELLGLNIKNEGSEVNVTTLEYLEKLITAFERGYGKPFVAGKPTSLMFGYVSQAIYEGSCNPDNGDTSWSYIKKAWGFPIGEYFTVDQLL